MLSGFYKLDHLNTKALKKFYKDVLMLSYFVILESKYTETHPTRRGIDTKYTIADFMKMVSTKNHNVCVDRSIQGTFIRSDGSTQLMTDSDKGEIGFRLSLDFDRHWHQITFYVTLKNLKILTEKYELQMS
jgi:hypothetical protein